MSQTQLPVSPTSERAGRQRWPLIVPVLFTLSGLLVLYMIVVDIVFGVKYFYLLNPATAGFPHALLFYLWMDSVPLAAILAGVGAAMAARMPAGRLWLMIGILVVAFVAPGSLVPVVASWSSWAFGVSGVLIILLVLLTCWFWAVERANPHPVQRPAADLRLISYVLFGMAAWWMCGVASSVLVCGDRLHDWAVVQGGIYSVMANLVLGWGFLFASQVLASRTTGSSEAQHDGALSPPQEDAVSVPHDESAHVQAGSM